MLLREHLHDASTVDGDLSVELCNECHPFFTGKQKLVDSGGRVERFNRRYGQRKNAPATPRRPPTTDPGHIDLTNAALRGGVCRFQHQVGPL